MTLSGPGWSATQRYVFARECTALDAPRAVLTARLKRLCDEGMLERVAYQDRPVRYEYRLTAKGLAFWDVLAAMWRWGSDWMWPEGEHPPVVLKDRESGEEIRPVVVDERTGRRLNLRSTRMGRSPRSSTPATPSPAPTSPD